MAELAEIYVLEASQSRISGEEPSSLPVCSALRSRSLWRLVGSDGAIYLPELARLSLPAEVLRSVFAWPSSRTCRKRFVHEHNILAQDALGAIWIGSAGVEV